MVYSHMLAKFIVGVLGWCFVVVCGVFFGFFFFWGGGVYYFFFWGGGWD